ncbi:MAG: PEGA domain-containing protein [Sphingomonadales bacterium]
MSFRLEIIAIDGARRQLDNQAPWAIGGDADADVKIDGAPPRTLAVIGCEDGHCFIQPMAAEAGLHRNGRPVGASIWLEDGDRLLLGGYRIACQISDQTLRLEIRDKATNGPPGNGAAGNGQAASAPPSAPPIAPDYRPRVASTPPATASKRVRHAIYAGFAVLALAGLFVLMAVPIDVRVTPAPERLDISGFPPTLAIGGQRLAWPGSYRVDAQREGYQPLSETISVSDQARTFDLEMAKLPGKLFLTVRPDDAQAWVAIDGETLGRAPLQGRPVPAGAHQLEITAKRFLTKTEAIEIEGMGREQRLELVLAPAWANVSMETEPSAAQVLLDGEAVGQTPLTLEILQGTHMLRFEKADHAPEEIEIDVTAGADQTIGPVKLMTLPATLLLNSKPEGASFTVGDRFLGRGPIETLVAPRRLLEVQAMMAGYKPARAQVSLAPDQTRRLNLELEPEYGTVFVRATPSDAQLEIDGQPAGAATQRLRLQTVAHRLRISKDGYAPFETTVVPKAGLSNEVAATLTPLTALQKMGIEKELVTAAGQKLLLFGPGAFTMGAPQREPGRRANEREQDVALTRRFYVSEHLVTNGEFRQFRPQHSSGVANRSTINLDNQPVVGISWEDAARYLNWLSVKDGLEPAYAEDGGGLKLKRPVGTGYRLPTEAEWAFVARIAGRPKRAKYGWGDAYPPPAKAGNFADESARGNLPVVIQGYDDGHPATAPVGSFAANPAGLFDIGGNAAEWMNDYYDIGPPRPTVLEDPLGPTAGSLRVVRGAGWRSATPQRLRLSFRDYSAEPRQDIGFRVARYARAP